MKIRLAIALVTLALGPVASAQQRVVQDPSQTKQLNTAAYIQLLRADLRANTEVIIREAMQLNEEQSAMFWPIYREYSAAQVKLGDEKLAIINDYTKNFMTMTDQKADQLAQRAMALDEQRMALRKKYYGIVSGKLGALLAVRFFEVEHQIQLILDLQLASNLPIIEEPQAK